MKSEIIIDKNKDEKLEKYISLTKMNVENAVKYLEDENWDLNKALDTFKMEKQKIEENKNGGFISGLTNFIINFCSKNDELVLNYEDQNKKRENKDKYNDNNIIFSKNQKNMGNNIYNLNKENTFNNSSSINNDNLFENKNIINISDNNVDNNFNNNISYNSIKNDSIDEFNINTNSKNNNFNDINSNNNSFFQDENLTTITFKFQDKKNPIIRKFLRTDTVQSLYDFINENLNNKGKNKKKKFLLVRPIPYKIYNDKNKKLDEVGLDQNPILHIREDD